MAETLHSVPEAAERLAMRERTIRQWILLRKIDYIKIGGAVRIPDSEIKRIIQEGRVRRIPTGTASRLVM